MRKEETLLFVGYGPETPDAIRYAKSLGVKTILTDNIPFENNPLKNAVDEYWDIDIYDVPALIEKSTRNGVTAFYAGSNEPCLDTVQELCKHFDYPFYASKEGWRGTRDKEYFKQIAEQAGFRIPRSYEVDNALSAEYLSKIEYPVIIKPVDACASRGISVCNNQNDLIKNFPNALNASKSKRVLVEKYIDGEFVGLFLVIHKGKATLHFCPNMSMLAKNPYDGSYNLYPLGNPNTHQDGWKPIIIATYISDLSSVEKKYEGRLEQKINNLVSLLHMQEGVMTLQAIADAEGRLYFFEMGYRLDGDLLWKVSSLSGDLDQVHISVDYALGRATPDEEFKKHLPQNKECGGFGLWLKPGTISEIRGIDKINEIPGVQLLARRYKAGQTVHTGTRTLADIAFLVAVTAPDKETFIARVQQTISMLEVLDTDNNEMLYPLD